MSTDSRPIMVRDISRLLTKLCVQGTHASVLVQVYDGEITLVEQTQKFKAGEQICSVLETKALANHN